jgi:hypothetical protein
MPVLITDPDVMDKFCQVEGEVFRRDQRHSDRQGSQYTVSYALKLWKETKDNYDAKETIDVAIYGLGGWSRYFVLAGTGEVVFSKYHAERKVKDAESAGFRIW